MNVMNTMNGMRISLSLAALAVSFHVSTRDARA